MRFYTKQECEDWLRSLDRELPDRVPETHVERVLYPDKPYGFLFLSHWIATSLTYREPVLLWITEWGIWSNSENWHLYYRLRQSYRDHRLLHEAPGHLFLGHEAEDFASFLQLCLLNGWGGYVLTHANYVNAFFSHDEYVEFFAMSDKNLESLREQFRKSQTTE